MNKIISLFAVFCIAISLLGCGGGGGGGNPVAPPAPTFDPALRADYPKVAESYDLLAVALLDSSGASASDRTNKFMDEIGTDFVKDDTPSYTSLKNATQSRLERYTVYAYNFIPEKYVKVDENTIKVTTYVYINVKRKPEAEGSVVALSDYVQPNPEITWKKYPDGAWKIYKGLPYLSSEVSFF